ncbi:MAG: outer membrane protein transport protein [Bacteroidia bacterium]|nr:outer membrane protein transport protein [Bacteroidia bacterium]
MNSSSSTKNRFSVLVIVMFLAVTGVLATDGYFSVGYGVQNKGVAGVGIANWEYSLINGNPAGNFYLGKTYSIGFGLFNPYRQYTITGNPSMLPGTFGLAPGNVESDNKTFPNGYIGGNWMLNEKSSLAVSIFGNGGMNTTYRTRTYGDPNNQDTGVDLLQIFTAVTYSTEIAPNHSLGFSGIFGYQAFEAKGLFNFGGFSSSPSNLTDNGDSNGSGFGFKVGYMGQLAEGLTLGASYQSKMWMGEFEEYAGLFAEEGDFDIPSSWTAGLKYGISEKVNVMLDVKQIFYSEVAAIANPLDVMANSPTDAMGNPNPAFNPLGSDGGWGFGWEDMTIVKFGIEFSPNEDWTFRGGYSYGKQPIPESEVLFNILAPGVIENHIALGFSKGIGSNGQQLHFAFNYALSTTVSGFNPLDFDPVASNPSTGSFVPNQAIDLEMSQLDFEVGITF